MLTGNSAVAKAMHNTDEVAVRARQPIRLVKTFDKKKVLSRNTGVPISDVLMYVYQHMYYHNFGSIQKCNMYHWN